MIPSDGPGYGELVAEVEKLRALKTQMATIIDTVRVMDTGRVVYIGVIALDGCASAEVRNEDREYFLEWKKRRDAVLASATGEQS